MGTGEDARVVEEWVGQGDAHAALVLSVARGETAKSAVAIVRRVHQNGGVIATMCQSQQVLAKAGLAYRKAGPQEPVAWDPQGRTIACVGPSVAVETACALVKALVAENQYRSFRQYNPWLFGGKDQFPPRIEQLR